MNHVELTYDNDVIFCTVCSTSRMSINNRSSMIRALCRTPYLVDLIMIIYQYH